MNARSRFVLAAMVVITSITCQTVIGGSTGQLDDASLSEAEGELQKILEGDILMGDLLEVDRDQNGAGDQIIYYYPEEDIATDILLETSLVYTSPEFDEAPNSDAYRKELWLTINNESQQEKRVQFNYEIPKEFAQYIDEVYFDPEPAEVINPDIVVMYDIVVPAPAAEPDQGFETGLWMSSVTVPPIVDYIIAKARLRADALKQMKERCKAASTEDKNDCYLSLITDFRDILDKKEMENMCNGETTGVERRICLSIAKDRAAECERASTPKDVQICKGFYVYQKCKGLDGGELQACLRDTAIANRAPLGCKDLEDADIRNECYANASGNAKYCARITNQARRENCQRALNAGSGQAGESQNGSGSFDPSNWFTGDKAKKDCQFYSDSLSLYTLSYSIGEYFHEIATLSCGMNSSDQYGNLYEGNVWIWAYDSPETAREVWETDETDGYTYATLKQQQEANADPDLKITLESDRYFSTYKREYSDRPPTYLIKAGSLYKNARIAILYRDMVDTSTSWWQIEALFKQMIDMKIQGG